MRVLHSLHSWLPRTQVWIHTQLRFLPEPWQSEVLSDRVENLDDFAVERRVSLQESPGGRFLSRLPGASRQAFRRRLVQAGGPRIGVVHSHFGDQAWLDLPLARRLGAAHVVTFYGYDVGHLPQAFPRWRRRYRTLFSEATLVLCEGPFMAARVAALGCPEAKLRVHPLGVDVQAIPFAPRRWQPGQPLRVLVASSFTEKKGIPFGLAALARLRAETRIDVRLCLVGGVAPNRRSRGEARRIEAAIREHGLGPSVERVGLVDHARMHEIAAGCHVFLAPSVTAPDGDSEGGAPVSLIEMAASGMAITSSVHCDIPAVVRSGDTGWLAEERDVDGLAARLRWWVDHPEGWQPMLVAGRRHVEAEFNAAKQGPRLAAHYLEVSRSPRPFASAPAGAAPQRA